MNDDIEESLLFFLTKEQMGFNQRIESAKNPFSNWSCDDLKRTYKTMLSGYRGSEADKDPIKFRQLKSTLESKGCVSLFGGRRRRSRSKSYKRKRSGKKATHRRRSSRKKTRGRRRSRH